MARPLTLVAWNANGVAGRRAELACFASEYDADVILLSETHLRPNNRFNIPAYTTYRSDRSVPIRMAASGGTAILVHRRVSHRHLPDPPTTQIEATAVAISVADTELRLVSVYNRPGLVPTPQELDALLDHDLPTIALGDMNCKDPSWNSRRSNHNGRTLLHYVSTRPDVLVIGPDDPTHIPSNPAHQPDVLDIVIVKNAVLPILVEAVSALSSDHNPLVVTLRLPCDTPPPRPVKRVNWLSYHDELSRFFPSAPEAPAPDKRELDSQVRYLQDVLAYCMDKHSYTVPALRRKTQLPPHVLDAIRQRRCLRRSWQTSRDPAVKRQYRRQSDYVKQLLLDVNQERWDEYLESLEVTHASVWEATGRLLGEKRTRHPLDSPSGAVYSPEGKAEVFANSLEEQFTPHRGVLDVDHVAHVEDFLQQYLAQPEPEPPLPFEKADLLSAISRLNPKRATGPDKIGATALKLAPPVVMDHILDIFNSCLRLNHFPRLWKTAEVIMIPKPGKSRMFPENYRPISLLPVISKVFERLLNARIAPLLDGHIRGEQFGFRREHSTTLQLVRVVTQFSDAANKKLHTAAVLLDVSKAFDRVWHEGLFYKLANTPLPTSTVRLLWSYLRGRTFHIRVDGALSSQRPIDAGVPQGSVLGPVLYLVYTNDLPVYTGVTLSLYADDAMYHYSSQNPDYAGKVIQRQLDLLPHWLRKWRVAINAEKSEAICITRKRHSCQPLSLDGKPITWQKSVKYLGVTIDSRLSFTDHANTKLRQARGVRAKIFPLISRRSPLSVQTKFTLYLLLIRSVLTYAAPAWWPLIPDTAKRRLESFQNSTARILSNSPWFVRNQAIRNGLRLQTVEEFVFRLSLNLFFRAAVSSFPHIRDLARDEGPPCHYIKRPRTLLDDPP